MIVIMIVIMIMISLNITSYKEPRLKVQWCPKSRWTLKGKIKGSPPCSRRTLLRTPWTMYHKPNHEQNHEQNQDSWTINQGLTLSTIRSSYKMQDIFTTLSQSFPFLLLWLCTSTSQDVHLFSLSITWIANKVHKNILNPYLQNIDNSYTSDCQIYLK